MTKSFNIYFHDLNKEAKSRYLEFMGVKDASELNEDLAPLAIVDVEDDNGK